MPRDRGVRGDRPGTASERPELLVGRDEVVTSPPQDQGRPASKLP